MKTYSKFSRLAEQAVNAEQTGNFADAALFWQDASVSARFRVNLEWAQARKAYCEQQHVRSIRSEKNKEVTATPDITL
ncbi:ANR family transcriptional regulator [Enterobacter ludwigii]|uniref:ANR family transcriptional regulator n=1 Tax=Enterobacter ludwigii TaxID=299767 RepID=UPI00159C731D|nr:ANR family transcriptional regulator [Enterobacter ludwigii]